MELSLPCQVSLIYGFLFDRYGFNSHGLEIVRKRLQTNFETRCDGIVGVNVGRNKMTADPVRDFLIGVKELGALADYIVINVSSPNTPGLRKMQGKEELENLISKVSFIICLKSCVDP